ncbi:MAG: hypothetical protein K6F35_07745 [Lachnospiraceae bacterium]|nr:hypothetical protein [Lachnospiraceae bacterium]
MNKTIRRLMAILFAGTLCVSLLAGCGGAAPEEMELDEEYYEDEDFEEEDYADDELVEEYEEETEDTETDEEKPEAGSNEAGKLSNDEIVELAKKYSGAPEAELDQVMENGNLYIHLYEDMDDHTATIDWYEIDPKTLQGTDFNGNKIDLSGSKSSDSEGDAGEGTKIADGEYVTDEEYTGELSADGKTMTITTALSEFVNSPSPTYPKQTYVINVSDSCKCVQFQEDKKETSFFDSMDLIKDFLTGKSGLPITLVFKNNELVEIQFSS